MSLRDADAYDILGLLPSATEAEIKRAFRDLARRTHPDVAPEPADGHEERFREARRAYEELIDAEARARLDRRRDAARRARARPEPLFQGQRGGGADEELAELLGRALWSVGAGGTGTLRERLKDGEERFEGRVTGSRRFEVDAVLTREEAREGMTIPFRFQLGPRLVRESIDIPAGVRRGERLSFDMWVAADICLEIIVHVDVE